MAILLTQHIFIGVDGGATKSIIRVEDEAGCLLGKDIAGPANIRISVDLAWKAINAALNSILAPLSLSLQNSAVQFHVGMGLAGSELVEAHQAFLSYAHPFHTLVVSSDSHIACLGAHGGEDGAIIIAGTGVVGFQTQRGHVTKVGGWGFPHDDEGGGAWLGLQAIKVTLQWLDGRMPSSGLAHAIYAHFSNKLQAIVSFANQANSTQFATLAPLVIAEMQHADPVAIQLLQQAALAMDQIAAALQSTQSEPLPCAFMGGVAPFLLPYLGRELRAHLCESKLSPDVGAILLAKQHLKIKESLIT